MLANYEDYIGEYDRRLYVRVKDHNGRDHFSYLIKRAGETGHLPVHTANFEVIGDRRKIDKPTLNIQVKSVPLKLVN